MIAPFRMAAPLVLLLLSSAGAQQLDEGWWIVVASIPDEDTERMQDDYTRVNAIVARCGFETFNDFSAKFDGFRPGYNVFVIGAYARRSDADAVRRLVRPCIPDAYVKYGRYLGE
jgi:hypothetical protein